MRAPRSTIHKLQTSERNFNRQHVSLCVREAHGTEIRETLNMPRMYLSPPR